MVSAKKKIVKKAPAKTRRRVAAGPEQSVPTPAHLVYVFAYCPEGGATHMDLATGALAITDRTGRLLVRTQGIPRMGPRRPRSLH